MKRPLHTVVIIRYIMDQETESNENLFSIVCSTTLWVGHLSKLIAEDDLSDMFGEFGEILSINTIPPRGCAFICMNRRMDAYKALKQLHKTKLHGKQMTVCAKKSNCRVSWGIYYITTNHIHIYPNYVI